MKNWLLLTIVLYATNANALSLHIGDASVPLSDTKNTSPALAVNVRDKTYYGALFADAPASKTLRIEFKGTDYWLGEFCAPGTYAPSGTNTCIACGVGHYCTGGHHRESCTYGAIGCPGTQNALDGALPDGAPINNLMTLAQVNEFIPVTNADQWQKISCCNAPQWAEAKPSNPSALNNAQYACATGTIGPGTYLFFTHYKSGSLGTVIDSINGETYSMSNAVIAVFDHPVSYASIHGISIFQHFIDTEHPTYTEWDFSTAPVTGWNTVNTNETNISNIINIKNSASSKWSNLCVYKLK